MGQTVAEYPLDPYKVVALPISREVTTITLPAPITAVVAADMLIENGRAGAIEVADARPAPSAPFRSRRTPGEI
jgi:hypothetical protein